VKGSYKKKLSRKDDAVNKPPPRTGNRGGTVVR